jgi:protease I
MARIGFIVDEMFEDSELRVPLDRARLSGHEVVVIGLIGGKIVSGKKGHDTVRIDVGIADVAADELDALVIPGGYSPDHLRTNEEVVDLVREMLADEKPVAAICHAGSLLVEADVCEGRTVTSWPSIKTDLVNAGARWVNREVVEDGNLITSRKPEDLEAFTDALLRQVERGPRTDDDVDDDDYEGVDLAR